MKELNDLNNIYQKMYSEDENKGYVVTAADKKGNTPAWQGYKSGKKKKDGKPMYRAADHLKNESVGSAVDKTLGAAGEIADTAIKLPAKAVGYVKGLKKGIKKAAKKGETKANEDFEFSPEVEKLIESGKFSEQEINLLVWNEFDEGYQRDPEKGEAAAKKADKRSAKEKRMADPEKGINSPAFREFMRSRGM